MKLTVGDIRFSESGYVSTTAKVWSEKAIFPVCGMDVSFPQVEGKSLEQYKDELLEVARERIAEIYKEIVCGGELDEEIIIPLCGKLNEKFNIKVVNKNGKLSVPNLDGGESDQLGCLGGKIEPSELSCKMKVAINDGDTDKELEERVAALEKRLGEQSSTDMLKAIHEASKKAALDFLSQSKHQIGECDEYFVDFPFRITDKCGQLFVHDEEGAGTPTHKHRDAIIARVIHDLKSENGNMLKRLGRCMGLLQVAAEIEAVNQICESECERCRESILSDFDNPPFKNAPIGWISPGVKYLKRRI
ncbi:hypothetical protein ACI258_004899 [Salmonella enterica subsp. enterica serovar Montevideo]